MCARSKRRSKLQPAVFPARGAAATPAWLSCKPAEWQAKRDACWDAVDDVLDVEKYLRRVRPSDDVAACVPPEALARRSKNKNLL